VCTAPYGKLIAELRASHAIQNHTCYPTQVNAPRLILSQAGRYSKYSLLHAEPGYYLDGWVSVFEEVNHLGI